MINGKSVLTVIPARGGSKGLPRKNILPLADKPLILWTIEKANKSKYIDRCIISTDDQEIADIAKYGGGDVPFIRPKELALDNTPTSEVLLHALKTINEKYDILLVLQPTTPLRSLEDIDGALETFVARNASSLVSVCESTQPPEWSVIIDKDNFFGNSAKLLMKEKRRQDYKKTYDLNGSIFLSNVNTYKKTKSFYSQEAVAYIIPKERSIDIDDKFDLDFAEYLLGIKLE